MAHSITHKQYLKIRDQVFTVISFDRRTKIRRLTYSGLNMISVIKEINKQQSYHGICLVFPGTFNTRTVWETPHRGNHLDDYEIVMKGK